MVVNVTTGTFTLKETNTNNNRGILTDYLLAKRITTYSQPGLPIDKNYIEFEYDDININANQKLNLNSDTTISGNLNITGGDLTCSTANLSVISSENNDIKISKDLIPSTDSSYDLGSSNYRYAYGYFDTCSATNFKGTTLCVGTTTVGSLSTYSIRARVDSAYDIGTSTMRFRTGYFDTVNTSTISSNTINVNTISGTYSGVVRPDNYYLKFNESINLTSTTSLIFGAGEVGSIDRGENLKNILDDINNDIYTVSTKVLTLSVTSIILLATASTTYSVAPGTQGLHITKAAVSYYSPVGYMRTVSGPGVFILK